MKWRYFALALKNIQRRGVRSWLTMLGIFIGIAAVVSLLSLGQGLEQAVAGQFQALGADRITVQAQSGGFGPPGQGAVNPLDEEDLEIVQNSRGVDAAAGRIIEQLIVEANDEQIVGFTATLPDDSEERRLVEEYFGEEMEAGRDLRSQDEGKVALGINYYERDVLGEQIRPGETLTIQGEEFEVTGIYERSGSFQTDTTIFMNEEDMRELIDEPDLYSIIFARVENTDRIEATVENVEEELRRDRNQDVGEEDFEVETSQETLDSLNQILNLVTAFVVGIAGISLIVGGVGIMNTMYTSVLERRKEIGIMKSVGARNEDILSIFMFESGILGFFGGLIGVVIGLGLAYLVQIVGTAVAGSGFIQATINLWVVGGALLFSFLVGLMSGVFPARQAASLKPVEALRE